jgi:hypothetical protein
MQICIDSFATAPLAHFERRPSNARMLVTGRVATMLLPIGNLHACLLSCPIFRMRQVFTIESLMERVPLSAGIPQ